MKQKLAPLFLALVGVAMLAIGIPRGYYEYTSEGVYFDPVSEVVYKEQNTEMLQIFGTLFLLVGVVLLLRKTRRLAS